MQNNELEDIIDRYHSEATGKIKVALNWGMALGFVPGLLLGIFIGLLYALAELSCL